MEGYFTFSETKASEHLAELKCERWTLLWCF